MSDELQALPEMTFEERAKARDQRKLLTAWRCNECDECRLGGISYLFAERQAHLHAKTSGHAVSIWALGQDEAR